MRMPFTDEHWNDANGNPAGGVSFGHGCCISWQNGPLGRGAGRREPNGAFVETVLQMVYNRLAFYQASPFACQANADAMDHIQAALLALDERTKDRETRQVEGTHTA